jgi:hypothetical protein
MHSGLAIQIGQVAVARAHEKQRWLLLVFQPALGKISTPVEGHKGADFLMMWG